MPFASQSPILMMLISMEYDLTLQRQFLMQHKLFLSKAVGMLSSRIHIEPGNQADRQLQARIYQLNEAEKVLDMRIRNISDRIQAIQNYKKEVGDQVNQAAQTEFGNSRR